MSYNLYILILFACVAIAAIDTARALCYNARTVAFGEPQRRRQTCIIP